MKDILAVSCRHVATCLVPLLCASFAFLAAAPTGAAVGHGCPSLGGEEVDVLGDGRFVLAGERASLVLTAGLWVGALADRGAGESAGVSGTVFSDDFAAVSAAAPCERIVRYTDVGGARPGHQPLGLEVTQTIRAGRPDPTDGILVRYRIRNVSGRVDPSGRGWVLRNAYVGILADPDVGLPAAEGERHLDDQVALAPDHALGSLAYAFDEPGSVDDTALQFGIVLPRRSLHRFAVLDGPEPSSDAERYAWMRGDSDASPTFDPASSRAADHRFLVAVGPIESIAPGRSVVFEAFLGFGDLVATARFPREAPVHPATATAISVSPNPVRLSAPGVVLRGLPERGEVSIYSVAGRVVDRVPVSGAVASWDLRGPDGAPVSPGVYFYRLHDGREPVGRIVVLR